MFACVTSAFPRLNTYKCEKRHGLTVEALESYVLGGLEHIRLEVYLKTYICLTFCVCLPQETSGVRVLEGEKMLRQGQSQL